MYALCNKTVNSASYLIKSRLIQATFCPRRCLAKESGAVLNIGGISPPIPTPFKEDESIHYEKLQANLEKWNKFKFRGYVVQGSNGEYPYFNVQERISLIKAVKECLPRDKLLIAGSGCESTKATITLTQEMANRGADVSLVITPFYFKSGMTPSALISHYQAVADNSPIPVIVYNVPVNTGIDLDVETLIELSQHENIIGLKDSSGNISKLSLLAHRTRDSPGGFQILAGSASFLLPAYVIGCVGGICALGNVLGEELCMLEDLFKAGKMEEAKLLQHRLVAPNIAVTTKYGVPGLKAVLDAFGYFGGKTRMPLQPLSEKDKETVLRAFRDNQFLK